MKKVFKVLFPASLWKKSFVFSVLCMLAMFLIFDVLWCFQTTFRPMSWATTYLYAFLASIVLCLPSVLLPRHRWVQLLLFIAVYIALEANLMYFRTYFCAIPGAAYLLVSNMAEFKDSIYDSFRISDVFLVFPLVAYCISIWKVKAEEVSVKIYSVSFVILLAVCYLLPLICFGGVEKDIRKVESAGHTLNCPVAAYTIFPKIYFDIKKGAKKLTAEELADIKTFIAEHNKNYVDAEYIETVKKRDVKIKNVVFLILESIESWPLGEKLNGVEISPCLNEVLQDSTVLYASEVVSQVRAGRSIDAQLLSLTGLHPLSDDVFTKLDNTYFSLLQTLKHSENSYYTYMLTGDPINTWNISHLVKMFEVDSILSRPCWDIKEQIRDYNYHLSDYDLFEQVIEKIRNGEFWTQSGNKYMQIATYSTHMPFTLRKEFRRVDFGEKYKEKLCDYCYSYNYADNAIGMFLQYMKSRPDYDSTMFVIMGDHEGLADYREDLYEDCPELVSKRKCVPFIVINSPVVGRITEVMGQVDVYSTLMDLLGFADYKWKGVGYSAIRTNHPKAAVGSAGDIVSNSEVSDSTATMLRRAQDISETIIKYNLLPQLVK